MQVDHALLIQMEKKCTGANSHNARGLMQKYVNACYVNDLEVVDCVRHEISMLLLRIAVMERKAA